MKSYTAFHPQTMPWDGVAASLLLSSNHQDKDLYALLLVKG